MPDTVNCTRCGKPLTALQIRKGNKFCCPDCQHRSITETMIKEVDETGEFPTRYSGEANRRFVRKYLEHKHGHVCSVCGRSEWDGQPIPLVVDHIDGNAMNSKVSNFRLVCGNCNMLLDTFSGRNRYGRSWRRKISEL